MVVDSKENTYEEVGSMDRVRGEWLQVVDVSCYGESWPLMNNKKVWGWAGMASHAPSTVQDLKSI